MRNDWSKTRPNGRISDRVWRMSAAIRPVKESLLDVIAREFRPLRFAQELLARASGKTPRAARNWLDGRCTPDAEALIELMASCSSIADEVERLVAERRMAREKEQCRGLHCGGAVSVSVETLALHHPIG